MSTRFPSFAHFMSVRRPRVDTSNFSTLPVAGLTSARFCKLGIWRRLVLMLLWLTLLPVSGFLPVTAQTWDIMGGSTESRPEVTEDLLMAAV